MFLVRIRLTGATQFVDSSPVVSFQESIKGDDLPRGIAPVIKGWSLRFQGTAPTVALTLRPRSGSPAVDEHIPVYVPLDPITNGRASELCGPKYSGITVPRRYGFEAAAQPPTGGSKVVTGECYGLFLTTSGKDNDGTFLCWYSFERVGQG